MAMKRFALALVVILGIASFACAEEQPSDDAAQESTPSPEATPESSPQPEPPPELSTLDQRIVVDAKANIYASGRDFLPAPAGGGGGTWPPGWRLPPGTDTVMFPKVTGEITPIIGTAAKHGPGGTDSYTTSVNSFEGISGIDHQRRQMFLVGVFLTDRPPHEPTPPTLDFTKRRTDVIAPLIGQVFYIGDGKDYRYKVPRRATRVFVGFADGGFGKGPVGWYDNNDGESEVSVAVGKG